MNEHTPSIQDLVANLHNKMNALEIKYWMIQENEGENMTVICQIKASGFVSQPNLSNSDWTL